MGISRKEPTVRCPLDYSKLRGRIIEKYGKQSAFAAAIGFSEKSVSDWLNNKKYWPYEAMAVAIDVLEIQDAEVGTYFFTKSVQVT